MRILACLAALQEIPSFLREIQSLTPTSPKTLTKQHSAQSPKLLFFLMAREMAQIEAGELTLY